MKKIPLTRGFFALVSDKDYKWLSQWKWCLIKGRNTFYAMRAIYVNGKQINIYMHRFIKDAKVDEQVDHHDRNGLNNQRSNLRIASHAENQRNSKLRKDNKSGFKGVAWSTNPKYRKKWICGLRVDGKTIHLGRFFDRVDAAKAYNKAAKKHYGKFARLNEIPKLPRVSSQSRMGRAARAGFQVAWPAL